ncbi:MAG: efflux RND transporter periplasmic adaptor subunit [Gammaproteobacteria bacterium]|nr:efflux RND transporter periplasmic adaptor subunit [Gammaproteobacteria bacterium]MBV9727625.1 efflux RND transporter periplasmic adaptor subunit [Gammaproteobacteria bacterium]
MGTSPEHVPSPPESRSEPVTWIGRDRAFERSPEPLAEHEALPQLVREDPGFASRWKWTLGGLAALLLIALVAWRLLAGGTKPPAALADRGAVPLVSVIVPGRQSVTSNVTFTGAIAARYDMPIANEGDTGRIVAVYVEPGDLVKRGQLLARIDDSVLVQQVHRLEATLEQARAQAALSAAEYRRAEGVAAAGALSAEDIEKRRATSVTDAANVKVVAAQLAEAQARLARTHIVAPVEGTVLTRHAEVGQIANPGGDPLFRLESGGEVEMRGQIAEQDLAQVKTGQPATVYLTGIDRPFPGQVRLLGAIIDPQTRLGDIRIRLQPDPALRPGAFARAVVTVDKTQRPVLPQTAVMADSNGSYVLVVSAAGKVERRAVRVSGTTDGGVIIAEGLTGSERVVATAGGFLRDGEMVNVAPSAAGANAVAATP